jgi:7 transmembrane receptor (Secretin family)
VSTFLWILLGALYLTIFVVLGVATLRKGHYLLFVFGIFFPILWVIGAVIAPTERAATADARTGLQ